MKSTVCFNLAVVKRVPPDADDVDLKLSQRHQHHHEALNMNLSSNHARSVVFLDKLSLVSIAIEARE